MNPKGIYYLFDYQMHRQIHEMKSACACFVHPVRWRVLQYAVSLLETKYGVSIIITAEMISCKEVLPASLTPQDHHLINTVLFPLHCARQILCADCYQRLIPEEKWEEKVLCWCCHSCLFPLQGTPRATCWQGTEERKPLLGSKFLTLIRESPIIDSIISVTTENHDSASL